MKEVFFMRHGLTRENELEIMIGTTNPSLSDRGKAELHAIKDYVVKPDVIFSSDSRRAFETAEILFPNMNVTYIPQLRERDWGVLEGKTLDFTRKSGLLRVEDEEILKQNGIETSSSLRVRANHIMQLISQTQAQKILMISHGGFLNFIMRTMLPENFKREALANANYHKIIFNSDEKIIDVKMNQSWLNKSLS
ncbi:MAG: alpha-ribazole phosphatase [Thermoproteota archaeon]|nr:alpha-ribazole phosphatase [Thermoproteota archaeon]